MLAEQLALLNMKTEYKAFTAFIKIVKIDTAVFVPYTDEGLKTYLPESDRIHELHLFSHPLNEECYQSEISLKEDMEEEHPILKKNAHNFFCHFFILFATSTVRSALF